GNGGSGNGDSGRGNSQSSGQQKGANGSGGGTHAITDDVKNALAQIAASTIAHPADATAAVEAGQPNAESAEASAEGSAAAQGSAVDSAQSPADVKNIDNESRRQTRAEHGSERPDASPTQTDESPVAAEAPVAILDIPVKKSARTSRRISTQDAEQILDSVLDALPEPKQPGQGRSRVSRRASSAGTVTPTSEDSAN
ncbi:MAG: ribonuclease, partial [Microbacteriaceae bacterium]|nr:ribonuclease [Microbacteriaceae bacterium]